MAALVVTLPSNDCLWRFLCDLIDMQTMIPVSLGSVVYSSCPL
jgi:hypothetical protein